MSIFQIIKAHINPTHILIDGLTSRTQELKMIIPNGVIDAANSKVIKTAKLSTV